MIQQSLTGAQPDFFRPDEIGQIKFVFKRWMITTWVLLLLPSYPLLTYTSTNPIFWQRYSPEYATGLLIYLFSLLGWLLLIFLPRQYLAWVNRSIGLLNTHPLAKAQFVVTWIFLTLFTLTIMRLWGWSYNWLLGIDVLILGLWLSSLPMFWEWGLKGWPLKRVSFDRIFEWVAQFPYLWLPPLLGIGVLLASNFLGISASPRQLMLLLGLLLGLGAVLILMRWPPFGLVALIFTSLLVPSPSLPGGLNVAVLLLALLLGLWLLELIVSRRKEWLVQSRTIWPLLALIVVATLSFGVGQLSWFSFAQQAPFDAQVGGLAIFLFAIGAFLLVAHQIRDLLWLQWLTWLFLGLGALYIAGWLLPGIGPVTTDLFQYGVGNNSMFWVWLVALAFGQAVFNNKLHWVWRLMLGGLVVATIYVAFVLNSGWKSGYLPALVSIVAIIGFRDWRVTLVLVLVGAMPAIYLSLQAIATDEYSYLTRIDAWLIMLEIIKSNPILGFGPANYYWYTPLFPIRGYAVRFNSHNQYLDIVAQTGLAGLACVLLFAWEVGRLGWQLRTGAPAGFARAYVYGTLGGLAGMLVSGMLVDWFLPFVYNVGLTGFRASMLPWLFLGGLVSIEQIMRHQTLS